MYSDRLDGFNPESFMEWTRLERYMHDGENPFVRHFKHLGLLSHGGDRWGVDKEGVNYPEPHRNQVMGLLAHFIEDIEALKDPVVMVMPDPTAYAVKDLNKLERFHAVGRYQFKDEESVFFPDPNAVSPRWRYENQDSGRIRDLSSIFQNSDGKRIPQIGHHYERPFEGWSVFVCEKECDYITPESNVKLGDLVCSDSPFVQMTTKEAYIMKALGFVPMDEEDAEVMLGQYDPKNGQFPILWHEMSSDMSRFIHSVSGVSLHEFIGEYTKLPRRKTRRLVVRRGFRLPSFAGVAERICTNERNNMRRQIFFETKRMTGEDISESLYKGWEWAQPAQQPMDRMTALLQSVKAMQEESRRAVDALLRVAVASHGNEIEVRRLESELVREKEANFEKSAIIEAQRREIAQLRSRQDAPRTMRTPSIFGLSITPERLKHLDKAQLKKLLKSLTQFFHPDRFNGVSEAERTAANDQFRQLKEVLETEIRRRG